MGTRIESAATATPRARLPRVPRLIGGGALHLSDAAARACLRRAHHHAGELDILINAGVYKDLNLAEPALASIIQEDIGANPGRPPRPCHHGTFSFDLVQGAGGVVAAAQLVDTFTGSGAARLGMIVTADTDPSPGTSRYFPFAAAGGAVLLAHAPDERGFQRFEQHTFAEDAALFESHLRWDPAAGLTRRGRNVLEIRESPAFGPQAVARAAEAAAGFLDRAGVRPADIDLVIASQYPRQFPTAVAARLGIPSDRVPRVPRALSASHTAGPLAALEAALDSGQLAAARRVLFVTAGAGITVSLALYSATAA